MVSDRRGEGGGNRTKREGENRYRKIQEGRPDKGQEAPPGPGGVQRPQAAHRPPGIVPPEPRPAQKPLLAIGTPLSESQPGARQLEALSGKTFWKAKTF